LRFRGAAPRGQWSRKSAFVGSQVPGTVLKSGIAWKKIDNQAVKEETLATDVGTPSDNETAVRRLIEEAWNGGNLAVTEELVSPDAVDHDPARPRGLPQGREGLKQTISMYRDAFPDLKLSIDDLLAQGDKVVWRWHAEGTHTGEYQGLLPTGRRGEVTGISIARMEDGRVAETWIEWDNFGLLQQLGMAPGPGSRGEWLGIQAQRLGVRARETATRLRERVAESRPQ
jgi:steroid delta-isomerase-like uncharacterized protein